MERINAAKSIQKISRQVGAARSGAMKDASPHPLRLRRETHEGRVIRCDAGRPANLAATLRAAVARAGDAEAVVDGERRMTWRELEARVDAVAAALTDMGIAGGDRVALLLGNRLEVPVILYACAVVGAIAVPMNLRQSADETAWVLGHSGARLLFHEAGARMPATEATPALAARIAVADDLPLPAAAPRAFAPVDEEAPFCILYTSGTTGRPKGAVLTHLNVAHSIAHFCHHYDLREGEHCLLAVPASHVTGLVALIAVSVTLAGRLIIMRDFKAGRFLQLAAAERMSYTLMVPAMYVLALMEPSFDAATLGAWRVGGFGGAPMPDATIAELARRLPGLALHNTYGATETTSPAVIMPAAETAARSRQLGRPVACCDFAIMDKDGREVATGESGEIWMAGPMVSPGYWNDPEATAAAFAGGYWKSGDIGSIDEDGFVTLLDRMKDMINRGGFKIYSVEVENILCEHPAVIEAAVVGRPCPVLGERVAAFVTIAATAGADAGEPVDGATLRAYCAARLSDYKVPETIRIEPAPLPRNANGKLLKSALRERLAATPD